MKHDSLRALVLLATVAAITAARGQAPAPVGPARTAAPAPAENSPTPNPPYAGELERVTVHGTALVGNLEGDPADRQVSVYLPPSYAHEPQRRYPVLYMLHGFTDSDSRWFGLQGQHFVNLPRAIDHAFAHGVREMIVVMPDAFTKYQGSMYSNSAVTGNWEAFVTQDLVRFMDTRYRTLASRASRGLAGHSMGGYGTLRIGMKYPQVFSSLYALSPCCLGASLEPSAEVTSKAAQVLTSEQIAAADFPTKAMLASAAAWSPDPARPPRYFVLPVEDGKPVPAIIAEWAANAPLAMVNQYIPNLRMFDAIAFDAGDHDEGIAATIKTLDGILSGYRLAHTFAIYEGNHVDHIQQRLEEHVLPFFSQHLKFE